MSGLELRAWRDRKGWPQQRLAAALGVPIRTLSRWETGAHAIQHPKMLRLALERLAQAP